MSEWSRSHLELDRWEGVIHFSGVGGNILIRPLKDVSPEGIEV